MNAADEACDRWDMEGVAITETVRKEEDVEAVACCGGSTCAVVGAAGA